MINKELVKMPKTPEKLLVIRMAEGHYGHAGRPGNSGGSAPAMPSGVGLTTTGDAMRYLTGLTIRWPRVKLAKDREKAMQMQKDLFSLRDKLKNHKPSVGRIDGLLGEVSAHIKTMGGKGDFTKNMPVIDKPLSPLGAS